MLKNLDLEKRKEGSEFPCLAGTLVGYLRLESIQNYLRVSLINKIPGDYIETGAWRGRASMFVRAGMHAHGEEKSRKSSVCDSFHGLPPGDRELDARDKVGITHRIWKSMKPLLLEAIKSIVC